MTSKFQRVLSITIASAALAAGLGLFAAPAGAAVGARNAKFCTAFTSDPKAGIIFGVPGRAQAKHTAALLRSLAKTGVPTTLGKNLKKLAKIYAPIASGQASTVVVAAHQAFITNVMEQLTRYIESNCSGTVPSS
jgi:hypothetical protein